MTQRKSAELKLAKVCRRLAKDATREAERLERRASQRAKRSRNV
jgi:hypothetical protein